MLIFTVGHQFAKFGLVCSIFIMCCVNTVLDFMYSILNTDFTAGVAAVSCTHCFAFICKISVYVAALAPSVVNGFSFPLS
jgi:hypothetical protein